MSVEKKSQDRRKKEIDDAELLRAVVETAVDGIITIDESGLITTANPAVERIFGYSPHQIVGKNVSMLMPAPYREQHDQYLANYAETGVRQIIGSGREVSGLRLDGTVFPLELAVAETITESGRIFTGIIRDISERKRAEEELRRERGLLRAVVETAVDGIIVIDGAGKIISANPATERIFGYCQDELLGKNVRMLMPQPYHAEHDQYLTNYQQTGHRKIIGIGREVKGLRKNGETFPLDLAVSETLTEQGLIFTGIVRDITERKRTEEIAQARNLAEQMSRENEERMRGILEFLQDVIFSLSPDGRTMVYCSTAVEQVFGRPRQEFYDNPKAWIDSVFEEDRAYAIQSQQQFIEQGELHAEYRIEMPDGRIKWICAHGQRILDEEGKVIRLDGIARDITEETLAAQSVTRAKNEAEEANKAKSTFLSRMSHELRTPMNAILGFGQLLQFSDLNKVQRENLDFIMKAGRHLLGLINDVLEISRIELGTIGLSLEPVDVTDVIHDALSLIRPSANDRLITLKVDAPSFYATADRQRLRQVMINLLSNAVKYNHNGGSVCVSVQAQFDDVVISVADTGPGISEQKLSRLFTPFERLGAEGLGIEGTGLGLALSKTLTEVMGGKIEVRTAEGEGSTFTVNLKLANLRCDSRELRTELSTSRESVTLGHRKVLLIEDNLTNAELIKRIFESRPNIDLLTTMQGRLGLELASDHVPDLILLDLHLPDIPGHEVLIELKVNPRLRHIPVIVVSADAFRSQSDRILASGAFAYVTKPFVVSEFLDQVDEALQGSGCHA